MERIKLFFAAIFAAFADILHSASFGYMRKIGGLLCAAHTAVASHTDATYAISASLPATYDSSGYGATTITYTAIGKVQSFMPYGSKRAVSTFKPVAGAAEYLKGTPEYGQGDMVVGDVPADAGQVIVKAAEASQNHYSLKITYADNEIHYLDVLVSGWVLSGGSEGSPLLRTGTLNICKAPVIVAAA